MKARSEAKIGGTGQVIGIELEDHDMGDVEGWAELPIASRWKKMTQRADMMVVEYMLRNGHVSPEWAGERIKAIQGG